MSFWLTFRDNKIAWYENEAVNFTSTGIIATDAVAARAVYTADVDGDGDTDVLSGIFS